MNVTRALETEGPRAYWALRDRERDLMRDLHKARAELRQMEELAIVADVDLSIPPEKAAGL